MGLYKRNFTIFVLALMLMHGMARAACTSPAGLEGQMIYNSDIHVYQYCNNTNWMRIGPTTAAGVLSCTSSGGCPNVGDVCADGTLFAGCTYDTAVAIYTTRCQPGRTYSSGSCSGTALTKCFGDCSGNTPLTTATDYFNGATNTAILVATDSNTVTGGTQLHQAADYCDNLSIHGKTDWYLPALYENVLLHLNTALLYDMTTASSVISSTDQNTTQYWQRVFTAGSHTIGNGNKGSLTAFRCVRR